MIPLFFAKTLARSTACAEIAEIYAKWHENGGSSIWLPYKRICSDYVAGTGWLVGLPGDTAHDCLQSMPFRTDLALQFLNQYWGYLQFHSTIDTLKS